MVKYLIIGGILVSIIIISFFIFNGNNEVINEKLNNISSKSDVLINDKVIEKRCDSQIIKCSKTGCEELCNG